MPQTDEEHRAGQSSIARTRDGDHGSLAQQVPAKAGTANQQPFEQQTGEPTMKTIITAVTATQFTAAATVSVADLYQGFAGNPDLAV